jgi:hypothetical protein
MDILFDAGHAMSGNEGSEAPHALSDEAIDLTQRTRRVSLRDKDHGVYLEGHCYCISIAAEIVRT